MTVTAGIIQTLTEGTAEKLNSLLRNWNASAQTDEHGPYVQLTQKQNPDGQNRRLLLDTLDANDDKDDLTRYCWNYWNVSSAQWHVSDLTSAGGIDDLVDFLVRHLEAE